MLGDPYSKCEEGPCSRKNCFSDCQRAKAELFCGCRDPLVADLCPTGLSTNITDTRNQLAYCDFKGMDCLMADDGSRSIVLNCMRMFQCKNATLLKQT